MSRLEECETYVIKANIPDTAISYCYLNVVYFLFPYFVVSAIILFLNLIIIVLSLFRNSLSNSRTISVPKLQ